MLASFSFVILISPLYHETEIPQCADKRFPAGRYIPKKQMQRASWDVHLIDNKYFEVNRCLHLLDNIINRADRILPKLGPDQDTKEVLYDCRLSDIC